MPPAGPPAGGQASSGMRCGEGVAVGLLTTWLCDRLKDKDLRLKINGEPVEISQEALRQALQRRTNGTEQ